MVHTLCGGYGTARLHDRIDWDRAGRPAHRLRLQRHHGPAPGARRPRRLGRRSTGRTSCASRDRRAIRADRGDGGLVPSRLQARAARARVRGPRRPLRADGGRRPGGGAAGRRLPDTSDGEHRDALRGEDRRLRGDGRGPQHRAVPGRHGAQPPGPRRQARQRRRLRVRDRRELASIRPCPRGRSRRCRSRRSSTS